MVLPKFRIEPQKTLREVPERELINMAVRLYVLGALAWDYVDSILNIAAQMGITQTKRLSRAVRELKREYDKERAERMDDALVEQESEWALDFEDYIGKALKELTEGIRAETQDVDGKLQGDYLYLVMGVQQAMTVLEAMKIFARQCDTKIESYGVPPAHSILMDHFPRLMVMIPQYAGDCYIADSAARKKCAQRIVKALEQIEVRDKPNDSEQKEIDINHNNKNE